jgi:seryl-tRNA synthetase
MHDIKFIRENPDAFDAGLKRRGLGAEAAKIAGMDEELRALITGLQEVQTKRNELSKQIGQLKAKGESADAVMAEVATLKQTVQDGEEKQRVLKDKRDVYLAEIPNLPHESVPAGESEADNPVIREVGKKPDLGFKPKQHFDLGEALGQMDFEGAAKMSGARFVILKGGLARLERALGQFMLDNALDSGYGEVSTPSLVKADALFGTGQLPKFEDDLFKTGDHYLIPTSEVTLSNIQRESILPEEDLPLRYTALTPCYRAEAGAAGKDTRGMIRQHQFTKVELVTITAPEKSLEELERKVSCAEEVLKKLGIAYRVVELCTGDIGFSARKTFDIEVWLPGQDTYREISSCSDCGDFQARRMKMRCRKTGEKDTRFPHTLNGSGLAVGRTLVAVLENYQNEDGSISVPEALQPYMGGLKKIEKA